MRKKENKQLKLDQMKKVINLKKKEDAVDYNIQLQK